MPGIRKNQSGKAAKKSAKKSWSADVTANSNALDLEKNVFKLGSAEKVASSLKGSAEKSKRRKAGPFQSVMSMLNFYINRRGKDLPPRRRATLENAKEKLRKLYGRQSKKPRTGAVERKNESKK